MNEYRFFNMRRAWGAGKLVKQIIHSNEPVVLLGGGDSSNMGREAALAKARTVVAADGGADMALILGRIPDAVFGDLDSLSTSAQAALPDGVLRPIEEQHSTDFDKCLRNINAPLIVGYGFLGGRVDHELAALSTLVARAGHKVILVGQEDVIVHAPPRIALDLAPGCRVSLFPMAKVSGRSRGLRWPIEGLGFSPDGQIGTSNEATGPIHIEMDAPGMLLILPRACLGALSEALMASDGWPAL
jgi:thiamine pyrophosphokinase